MARTLKELEERFEGEITALKSRLERVSLEAGLQDPSPEPPAAKPHSAESSSSRRRWQIGIAASIAGVVLGAVVQPWVTREMKGAVPTVESVRLQFEAVHPLSGLVSEMKATASGSKEKDIEVPQPLREASRKSKWTEPFSQAMSLATYIAKLQEDHETLEGLIDHAEALKADLTSWPSPVRMGNEQDARAVLALMIKHGSLVLGHVFGETRRGVSTFKNAVPVEDSASGGTPVLSVRTDHDGDFWVSASGQVETLGVLWSVNNSFGQHRKELEATGRRLAYAIACANTVDLESLRGAIDALLEQVDDVRPLAKLLESRIEEYSRWTLTILINNAGDEPVALGHEAAIYVKTRGIRVHDSAGIERAMVADARLDLRRVESQSLELQGLRIPIGAITTTEPIVVEPGGAVAVQYESRMPFECHSDWQGLLAVFRGAGSPCEVVIPLLGDQTSASLRSGVLQFSSSSGQFEWSGADEFWK